MNFEEFYPETWTTLTKAARSGDIAAVKFFIQKEKPTNIQDNKGWRPLHHAAYFGHVECVRLLLGASDVDINATTFERETALFLSCSNPELHPPLKVSVAKILLEAGADPNVENHNRHKTILNEVIYQGNTELVLLLINYKVDVNEVDDCFGSSLNSVAMGGTLEMIDILFKQRIIFPYPRNRNCLFFHSLAVHWRKRGQMLQFFIKKAECLTLINNQDEEGKTPIYLACNYGWREGIKLLLDYGADPNIRTKKGKLSVNVFLRHVEEDDLKNPQSAFLLLCKLINKIEFKRTYSSLQSSTLHSLVLSKNKYWKELYNLLEEMNPNMNPSLISIPYEKMVTPDFDDNINMFLLQRGTRITPLSLWCSFLDLQHDSRVLPFFLQKEKDINIQSDGNFPPLDAAICSKKSLAENPLQWQKNVYTLLKMGASLLIKLNEEDLIPAPFLFATYQNNLTILEFLLLHGVPAEMIFNEESMYGLLNWEPITESSKLWEYYLSDWFYQSFQLLMAKTFACAIKFLTTFPSRKICDQLQDIRRERFESIEESSSVALRISGGDQFKLTSEFRAVTNDIETSMKIPKPLWHLTSLRIRRALWDTGKHSCIGSSILDLCRELKLSHKFQALLMLNSDLYYERI